MQLIIFLCPVFFFFFSILLEFGDLKKNFFSRISLSFQNLTLKFKKKITEKCVKHGVKGTVFPARKLNVRKTPKFLDGKISLRLAGEWDGSGLQHSTQDCSSLRLQQHVGSVRDSSNCMFNHHSSQTGAETLVVYTF